MDPENLLVLFSGRWPGNESGIASLRFAATQPVKDTQLVNEVTEPVKEEENVEKPNSEEPKSEEPKSTASAITVLLYAVNEEATIAVLDGTTGDCLGPGPKQPQVSSKTLCIDLLGQQSFNTLDSVF